MNWIIQHWAEAAGVIVAAYEVIVRAIPTIHDYSLASRFIKWLKRISDFANIRK